MPSEGSIVVAGGHGTILIGDCRELMQSKMQEKSVHCVVTSPPYWRQRDYGADKRMEIGAERTPDEFIQHMVEVFRGVRRVLRDDGTVWLNLGDTSDDGNILMIPHRTAIALQADGWIVRQDIIWHKPSPMPESVKNRCTKAHEYIFLLVKQRGYFYDSDAIKQPSASPGQRKLLGGGNSSKYADIRKHGRQPDDPMYRGSHDQLNNVIVTEQFSNKRSVWTVPSAGDKSKHFAMFPPALIRPCILAGTSKRGCCSSCGAPVRRVTERERTATRPGLVTKVVGDGKVEGNRDPQRHVTTTRTLGWEPTCTCDVRLVPCVVFDPFLGSGTTVAEAVRLGRRGVGCELNAQYATEIAAKKITRFYHKKGFGLS